MSNCTSIGRWSVHVGRRSERVVQLICLSNKEIDINDYGVACERV